MLLEQISMFSRIAKEQSISKAAQAIHISQPVSYTHLCQQLQAIIKKQTKYTTCQEETPCRKKPWS